LVNGALEPSDQVQHQLATLYFDLGTALMDQGKVDEARAAFEKSLENRKNDPDPRGIGVVLFELGTLALKSANLAEAMLRYQEALVLARRLHEPTFESLVQHHLGVAYFEAAQWEQAERHYREAAAIRERIGDVAEAAKTWNELGLVAMQSGRPQAAETWFLKAIDGGKATGYTAGVATRLGNLATLLNSEPGRLHDARRFAEQSLAIKETLDHGSAEIWKTYELLAQIADQGQRPEAAADYRRLARESKRRFAGTAHELKRHLPLIVGTLKALGNPDLAQPFNAALSNLEAHGWTNLVAAIRKLLSGERDPDALCQDLSLQSSMIVDTILQALADPATLEALLADTEPEG
jgi:tetratricopeptide (TPR) repeat protein